MKKRDRLVRGYIESILHGDRSYWKRKKLCIIERKKEKGKKRKRKKERIRKKERKNKRIRILVGEDNK